MNARIDGGRLSRGAHATLRRAVVAVFAFCATCVPVLAGPPFFTDDPQPVDFSHYETYLFATGDRSDGATTKNGPAIEFNAGVLKNVQFHVVAPYTAVTGNGIPTASGYGDTEVGVKFRFVQETASRPQIGIFPMAELASGNAAKGLGNGRTWYRLPVWIQKSWGPWTTYGGGGVALNGAPGMQNYGFGGWLIQRDLSPKLTLGGELFTQGASAAGGSGVHALQPGRVL